MKRNLLTTEVIDDNIKCVNGYFLDGSPYCICYPGWTSEYNSIEQCNIKISGNDTHSTTQDIHITDNHSNGIFGDSIYEMAIKAGLILFVLACIFCALKCLFKKCRKVININHKIKENEKEKRRKEYEYDIDNEYDDDKSNSFNYKKQCEKNSKGNNSNSQKRNEKTKKEEEINKGCIELQIKSPK